MEILAMQGDHSPAMPPSAGTIFEMAPLPAFPALHDFVRGGGGTLLKLLRAGSSSGGAVTDSAGKLRGKEV